MTAVPGQAWSGSRCSKCNAPIVWALTVNGKYQPLDGQPNDAGNLRLLDEFHATDKGVLQRVVVVKADATLEFGDSGERWMPHHATCPYADEFRRPKAKTS